MPDSQPLTPATPTAHWYRDLVEFSPEAAYVVREGRIAYVNPAAVLLFGAPNAESLLGQDVLDRIHPDDHALALARRRQVLELGQPAPLVEMRFLGVDGRIFEVEVQATRIEFNGGPATYAAARDISARKRLEEQVREAQKLEAVGRLAGGVAHDFNNTLAIILGHAEFVRDALGPTHEHSEDINVILRAARHSASLTRQLLTYARKQTIAPRPLDLNAAVSDTLRMVRPLIGESIALTWEPEAGVWPVTLDPSQLDQILTNLCANARDAIEDVGTLTITTRNHRLSAAAARAIPEGQPGDYVVLSVTDSGRGMPPEVEERIFEPFFTTKPVGQGTGLGLSTVFGIMRQNHGLLTVRSGVGAGTTFDLYFPRQPAFVQSPPGGVATVASLPGGSESVLVVEDEVAILDLTCRALRAAGYQVQGANTAARALEILAEDPVDLLLTDVMMPQMSGPDLARLVRERHPAVSIVYMSGFSADLIARQGRLDPDIEFIGKPFTLAELTSRLRGVLDRRAAIA
ncbi:MAG: response regulator [Gemmatimonadaceae bacterium]|nr:response regulator [Gemmatimonadaceae bacterium]MCW5825238.1 response regulator [Gemmatimonadaceae bacterium]